MADSQFYVALSALDPGIANRWQRASGDNLKFELTANAVSAILAPVLDFRTKKALDTHKITRGQAEAIAKLLDSAKFAPGVREALLVLVIDAVELHYFVRGAGRPLETAAELADVTGALGHGSVGSINFYSPGSKLTYTSSLYQAVLDLVGRKEIKVTEVHAAGLNECARCKATLAARGVSGFYMGASNQLTVYQGDPTRKKLIIVHEATHAIQDWTDQPISNAHAEADAYIAAGVAAMNIGQAVFDKFNRYGETLKGAVNRVRSGAAVADNSTWPDAYADVVTYVENDPLYKDKAKSLFNAKEPKRAGGPEAAEWAKTLEKIKTMKRAP
jgi:hypothetical protein